MRIESEHAERLRTVLAGQPALQRGPRRALVELPEPDESPGLDGGFTVRPITPPPEVLEDDDLAGDDEPGELPPGALARVRAFTLRHLQAIAILVVVALVFTTVQLLRARPSEVPLVVPEVAVESTTSVPSGAESPSEVTLLVVHVTGAVKNPGIVRVPPGSRVNDAIEAAGGITAVAHLGTLNLAALVSDGMQILVASGPQETSTTTGDDGGGGPPGTDTNAALVNLNSATAAQLESLPGVGPATAAKILDWREQHGRFSKVEELQEVDGIGAKTFERLKPLVTV
ncbi:helix-hairpin-helix domain-containing protein [Propionibacteriaceae bacterium Y1923]